MSFPTSTPRLPTPAPTPAPPAADDDRPTDVRPGAGATGGDSVGNSRPERRLRARVTTALALLLVLFALLAPNKLGHFQPAAFARIPVEALLGVVAALVLPARARRVTAVLAGLGLGLLTIVKLLDMGFYAVLSRRFDPVLDWTLFNGAVQLLTESFGRPGAIGAVVAIAALAVGVLVLITMSILRLTALVVHHRAVAPGAVTAFGAVWVTCALLGAQLVPGLPVAARSAAGLTYGRAMQVRSGLLDQRAFAAESAVDAFRDTPGDQLLTGLRGKNVIFAFVESYGRDAVEDPEFAAQVGAVLEDGNRRLGAAGLASRSAYLTSPTAGGGSWLAQATFLSGLWIDNQQRYRNLVASDRLTLGSAFRRASWQTAAVKPGVDRAWPESAFYGYDRVYDSRNLGYRGPAFSWSDLPDQYALAAFQRLERAAPDRAPLMAEIALTSSHAPWAPIPRLIDWDDVGDGSVYGPIAAAGLSRNDVWRDPARVRTEYRRSIEYSLTSMISYLETYPDEDLVLVLLGDHQPAPIITGEDASRDVPITIVARDRAVLDRISEWGWHDGLNPGPRAPVWRMDRFRDRFLTTFGPQARTAAPPAR